MTDTTPSKPEADNRGMRSMLLALMLAALATALYSLVGGGNAGPDMSDNPEWVSAQEDYLASLTPEDGWQTLEGGLRWRLLKASGSTEKPTPQDRVTVHYTGTLVSGEVFDSSRESGTPVTFPLGSVIKAWQLAIPQMSIRDTIEIASPSDLAYGPRGKGPIPGGATLLFTVELLAIDRAN